MAYYSPYPPRQRNGCFTPFAQALLLIGLLFCLWMTPQLIASLRSIPSMRIPIPDIPTHLSNALAPAPTAPVAGASSSNVTGKPSLTPSFIKRVLAAYHSPAEGLGQTLYALSGQYGIDDAFPLAFFAHESSFGLQGVARYTFSLGNIRCTPGYACLDGYRAYRSWAKGAADWYALIAHVYVAHGLVTVEQIIPVYAPAADGNDVSAYISAVEQAVARWRQGRVA